MPAVRTAVALAGALSSVLLHADAFSAPPLPTLTARVTARSGFMAARCSTEGPLKGGKHHRSEFLRMAAATALIASQTFGNQAANAAKIGDGLECRAQIGGGQLCKNQKKEVEFKKAFDTKGTKTSATGDLNKMSTYYSQIDAGYQTLVDLADRWDSYIAAGDGDVIRRRLGTVGNKSPLHNIRKALEGALKVVAKSPDFEPERLDAMEEDLDKIMEGIAEIDYNLYSTAFVGTEEVAGGLRVEGKIALDRILGTYKKFTETIQILL